MSLYWKDNERLKAKPSSVLVFKGGAKCIYKL